MTEPAPDDELRTVVAGLAAELEALRRSVGLLHGIPSRVEELAELIARTAETAAPMPNPGHGTPSWLDFTGSAPEVRGLLDDLIAWVNRVYIQYFDARYALPECWLWHADVVEEILWLRHAWHGAYADEFAPTSKAADWHDRLRPGVVRRIREVAGRCSFEKHMTRRGQPPEHNRPRIVEQLPDGAVDCIAAWWANYRSQPPPEPQTCRPPTNGFVS